MSLISLAQHADKDGRDGRIANAFLVWIREGNRGSMPSSFVEEVEGREYRSPKQLSLERLLKFRFWRQHTQSTRESLEALNGIDEVLYNRAMESVVALGDAIDAILEAEFPSEHA